MAIRSSPETEAGIIDAVAACGRSPLRFVEAMFPWGMSGTELASAIGPDTWQADVLRAVERGLPLGAAIQVAVASGHGVGKSALVSWLCLWALATMPDTKGVVTANTQSQLATKTWAELAKWHRLCLCGHWFELTGTSLRSIDPAHERTWRIDAIPWSETNTEAFAGLHNFGKRVLVVMDEASAIPDVIWETTEGALTDRDTEIIWAVFGNPTRMTGRFRECFGRFRSRWITHQIDSRTARAANQQQIAKWVADYGEDSDFVRVRVRGVFPRAGSMQFISSELVEFAMSAERDVIATPMDPLVMGVDIARYGDDASVIRLRRGRDARSVPPIKLRGLDTMAVAARVAQEYEVHHPDAIFIDEGGVGGGVVDRCRMLRLPVVGVQFGARADLSVSTADGAIAYANKRAEMWGVMRDWLRGGMVDNDPELLADLTGVEYGYRMIDGRDHIQLESKADMKKRGLASPDNGDALALTFAYPVQPSDHRAVITGKHQAGLQADYRPFADRFGGTQQQQPTRGSWSGMGAWKR